VPRLVGPQQRQIRPDLFDAVKRRDPVVSNRVVKAREREFDPVLGKFRDVARESRTAARERSEAVEASNRGRDRQLKVSQRFDIITHKALVDDDAAPPPKPVSQTYRSRVGFNIVSNKPLSEHHYDKPESRPPREASPRAPRARVEHASMSRDYDIVSGRYVSDHEAKAARDVEVSRRRAADRWWQTRDFDPIRQRFYDAEKDEKERDVAAAAEARSRSRKEAAAPPRERFRENAGYDTLLHRVTDAGRLAAADARTKRPPKKPTRTATEARLVEEGVVAAARADARSVRRAGYKNVRDLPDRRPFDLVTGAPLAGVDALEARPEETASLMASVAAVEAAAGRRGRAGAAAAELGATGGSGWATRHGAVGGTLRRAGAGTVVLGASTFGTLGVGLGGEGDAAVAAPAEGVVMTTAGAARAVGAAPGHARVRDSSAQPAVVRAASGSRRVRSRGEAFRRTVARADAAAPSSTRVRRPGR